MVTILVPLVLACFRPQWPSSKFEVACFEPSPDPAAIPIMNRTREKQEIEAKLAKCGELAKEFPHGATAQMIREMEEELRQQIRELEKQ